MSPREGEAGVHVGRRIVAALHLTDSVSADLITALWALNLAWLQTHFNYHLPAFIRTDNTVH